MNKESVTNINHILKILIIIITVFFIGYFLESLRGISSMIGDYFLISTEILPLVLSFAIFIVTYLKYGLITMVVSYPVYFSYGYSEHLLRAAGFYFLYLAIYKSSIEQPYENLAPADERHVTERKNAESTMQASEKKYSTLVEKGNDGIVIIQDGNLKFVNSKIIQMIGFTIEEVLGKPFVDFIQKNFKETVIEIYKKRLSGEDLNKNYEIEIISKAGKNIPVEINASIIEYEGRPADMAILRDITERRQAQEALSWEIEENITISELSSTLLSQATIEDISVLVLCHAKRITGSKYGYAGYIDSKTGYLVCPSMSHDTMDVCKMKDSNNILKEFNGLFGWVLKNKKPLLTNSPSSDPRSSGTPDGHIPIFRFISAPAVLKENLIGQVSVGNPIGNKIHSIRYYDKGKLVGQVALANSDRDYTDCDLAFVERLTDIYAIAINRYLAEEKIKQSLKEKEVLLREIHHRVKNNMQIISSLLSLQSNSMPEEKYKGIFKESQNRIISMALIHEKLYHSRDIERIDFKEYIDDLARSLFQSYEVYGNIELRIDVKNVFLGIDFAIPCGLIINELVTNSIKYGFPDGRKGMISILIKSNDTGYVELEVNDNGIGIPEGFDISKTTSLGLHLVTLLSDQLNGEISWDGNDGTKFKITFKEVVK